jgi:hypothetical protein
MLTAYRRSPEVAALAEAGQSSREIAEATGKGRAVVTDILWRAGYRWRWKMFGQIGSRRQLFREKVRMEILNQPGRWKQKERRVAASLRRAWQRKGVRVNILQRWFQKKQVRKAWVKFYDWPSPDPLDFGRGTVKQVETFLGHDDSILWVNNWTEPDGTNTKRAIFELLIRANRQYFNRLKP